MTSLQQELVPLHVSLHVSRYTEIRIREVRFLPNVREKHENNRYWTKIFAGGG